MGVTRGLALEIPRALGVDFDPCSLQEQGGATVNAGELPRVYLGHLEDEDACTDDKKAENNRDNLCCTRFETLVENNGGEERAKGEHLVKV